MKKGLFGLIFIILLSLLFTLANTSFILADDEVREIEQNEEELPVPIRAKIIKVISNDNEETEYSGGTIETRSQLLEVKVLQGLHKGKIIKAHHYLNSFNEAYNILLTEGKEVFLYIEENEDGSIEKAFVAEIVRDRYLLYLTIIFILSILIVGKLKGLKSLISLSITCAAVIYILLPMILKGYDPVLVSVMVCVGIIIITLIMVSGFNHKTLSAIVGTAGGVITAGVIALIVGYLTNLTGLGDEESQMLMYIPQNIKFDFRGLLFSGIIIGAMGAVMDVAVSIASAVNEVALVNSDAKTRDLIKAGMNVGRDILGTMADTLILAYASASIPLMLLLMAYNVSFVEIINRELIASEVVRALSSSIGLVVTVPLTAVVAGTLVKRKKTGIKMKHNNVDFRY
ncbi:MAG: YibE/F family protein [Bacillota bacterium]